MRVIVADDSVLLREGLARVLTHAGFTLTGMAGDAQELLRLVDRQPPDVAVVDIRMPPTFSNEGVRAAHVIRETYPAVGVLVLSQYVETAYALQLVSDGTGAVGYLLKDRVAHITQFTDAIHQVGRGEAVIDPEVVRHLLRRPRETDPLGALTPRELEVLALMAEGRSNRAVSEQLFLSGKTIESHVASIFTKLGLQPTADDHRRVLAVMTYLRRGAADTPADPKPLGETWPSARVGC